MYCDDSGRGSEHGELQLVVHRLCLRRAGAQRLSPDSYPCITDAIKDVVPRDRRGPECVHGRGVAWSDVRPRPPEFALPNQRGARERGTPRWGSVWASPSVPVEGTSASARMDGAGSPSAGSKPLFGSFCSIDSVCVCVCVLPVCTRTHAYIWTRMHR